MAACGCGWTGSSHAPTEEGRIEAEDAWDAEHASPLLRVAVPSQVRDAMAVAQREVAALARERPDAALAALAAIGRWALTLTKELGRGPVARRGRSGLGL